MKRSFFTLAIVLLAVAAQAQIKVHDDGHVSIGSLTHSYGVQVHPNGYTSFRTQSDAPQADTSQMSIMMIMMKWMFLKGHITKEPTIQTS